MVLEIQRIIKDGKLDSLFYIKENTLFQFKEKEIEIKKIDNNTEMFLLINKYCFDNECKKINSILMEAEDIKEFFETTNKKRKKSFNI
jgi:hypothetical protein